MKFLFLLLCSLSLLFSSTTKCKSTEKFNDKTKKCELIKKEVKKEVPKEIKDPETISYINSLKGKTYNISGYFIEDKLYEIRSSKLLFPRTKDIDYTKIKGYLVQKDSSTFYYVTKDLQNISYLKSIDENNKLNWFYMKKPFKNKILEKNSRIIFPLS